MLCRLPPRPVRGLAALCTAALLVSGDAGASDGPQASAGQETVAVTANRYPLTIEELPQAVTVIGREQIEASAARTVAELLSTAPGVHVYDTSSAGSAPVADLRGFYSVGETSYLLVLIDGIPVNELDTDGIDWTRIALDQIERIELLRGPVSAQYGNIGMTGAVNIVTRSRADGPAWSARLGAGSDGQRAAGLAGAYGGERIALRFDAERRRVDGWRDRSGAVNDIAALSVVTSPSGQPPTSITTRWSAQYQDHDRDDPGALLAGDDPRQSRVPNDREHARRIALSGSVHVDWSAQRQLSFDLRWQDKRQEKIRTVFFQDPTQSIDAQAIGWSARYGQPVGRVRVLVGVEAERGELDSRYTLEQPLRLSTSTRADRDALAAFGWAEWPITGRISLIGALRHDRIDGRAQLEDGSRPETVKSATSPAVALNVNYGAGRNLWLTWSRAFKAPTLEQLFDRRPIVFFVPDVGLVPVVLSNAAIEPLRGRQIEIGWRTPLGALGSAELVIYDAAIHDEIGFDAVHFAYANISASRHRGFEAHWSAALLPTLRAQSSLSWMQAQFDGGPNDGNQINGVPEWLWAGSVRWNPHPAWTVSIEGQHVRDQYFDEANREAIGSYTLVNLALGWKRGPWSVEVRGRNLLDQEYVSTGFMAPAENGAFVPYHYPGAPRTAELLLRWRM